LNFNPFFARLHRLLDSWAGALLGALLYGGWACWANRSAGALHATGIGVAHAVMSFCLTLGGVKIMNLFFSLPSDPRAGALSAFAGSMTATYSLLVSVHLAIGTPHILLTLAPGLLPTAGFCLAYSLLLLRQSRHSNTPTHALATDLR
jgi:hypothetical protein